MLKFFFIVLLTVTLLAVEPTYAGADTTNTDDRKMLNVVRIYSLPWDVLINSAVTAKAFVDQEERIGIKTEVRSGSWLAAMERFATGELKLYDREHRSPMNVRTVCLLEWQGGVIDTLAFNNFDYFEFGRQYYYLQPELLEHILSILPYKQTIMIKELKEYWNEDTR